MPRPKKTADHILTAALNHLSIAKPPPTSSVEAELRWYFTHREAREPLASNFAGLVEKIARERPAFEKLVRDRREDRTSSSPVATPQASVETRHDSSSEEAQHDAPTDEAQRDEPRAPAMSVDWSPDDEPASPLSQAQSVSPSAEVLLIDAERRHRIERVLHALDPTTFEILEAAFDPTISPEVYGLKSLSSLVLRLPAVRSAHRAARSGLRLISWLGRRLEAAQRDPQVRLQIAGFRLAAQNCREEGIRAYLDMRRKVGRTAGPNAYPWRQS